MNKDLYDKADLAPVHEAIKAAALAMPSLRKGERNAHGNYAYVSIDDYFEQAAKVAHTHGLTWAVRETGSELVVVGEKQVGGKAVPQWAMKFTYEVDLMHDSGVRIEEFFSASIIHPLQGAQTAGSAMSYVAKLFMRNTFSIVTGEKDADATAPGFVEEDPFGLGATTPAPAPQKAPAPPKSQRSGGAADGYYTGDPNEKMELDRADALAAAEDRVEHELRLKLAMDWIGACKTEQELRAYWVQNEAEFKKIEAFDKKDYEKLVGAFKERKGALSTPA